MSFAFPHSEEGSSLASPSIANIEVHDVMVPVSLTAMKVVVPAGAYSVRAAILNPSEVPAYQGLSWEDAVGGVAEFASPLLQLTCDLMVVRDVVATYPATDISFPLGAHGVVAVMGPVGFPVPVVSLDL